MSEEHDQEIDDYSEQIYQKYRNFSSQELQQLGVLYTNIVQLPTHTTTTSMRNFLQNTPQLQWILLLACLTTTVLTSFPIGFVMGILTKTYAIHQQLTLGAIAGALAGVLVSYSVLKMVQIRVIH